MGSKKSTPLQTGLLQTLEIKKKLVDAALCVTD
jgi:hypothetical protein